MSVFDSIEGDGVIGCSKVMVNVSPLLMPYWLLASSATKERMELPVVPTRSNQKMAMILIWHAV